MTNRPESEGDGKVSRTYSLASAPLRLLSHSFHSTANAHNPGTSNLIQQSVADNHWHGSDFVLKDDSYSYSNSIPSTSISSSSSSSSSSSTQSSILAPTTSSIENIHLSNLLLDNPLCPSLNYIEPTPVPLSPLICHQQRIQPQQTQAQHVSHQQQPIASSSSSSSGTIPCKEHFLETLLSKPRKVSRLATVPKSHVLVRADAARKRQKELAESSARLERLLTPYDIRYSIFGHLSLQDIYSCQLTSKLLYWATSDQLIWKRIALNLIQGEFYFDIPRTLPTNIPSWKFFCKRHSLRQRNWRRGLVQDVISLDDNYRKLTTLQIISPFVLTGCDDGRVHLWNINTRTLAHRFQIHGEITWVEHLQDQKIVAGLGYDNEKFTSEIRLFSTETGEQIGFYKEDFWDLAICAVNKTFLVASDGKGRYTTWNWRSGTKVSYFKVEDEETSITEALYLIQDTILELHYDGLIRLFSIQGECYGRFTLDNILPNHQVSFCWLHNDLSMVVWEKSNTMAHIRLPLLVQNRDGGEGGDGQNNLGLARPISQEEWDSQGAEVYWRHQLEHDCNFAAMGGGRYQLLYVQIYENLSDQVPIRVHSLRRSGSGPTTAAAATASNSSEVAQASQSEVEGEGYGYGYGWQHGEYVTAHSLNPTLEKIIQGLRPSRIDCDPEYIVVGLVQGGVRLLQFAPVDEELFEQSSL